MEFNWFLLAGAAFFAGMVDAVVGGGGLIQIPVLLSQFPQTAIPTLFGTNKLSSLAGTASSLWRYARTVSIPWAVVLPATLAALLGAWLGAAVTAWLPREAMRPLVLVMMLAVALYTFLRKDFGHVEARTLVPADRWRAALLGLVIGFYDGFFGPGTGSFLIFLFVRFFGLDFLRASAASKVVNLATNVAAISFFVPTGNILWLFALPMAAANIIGSVVGTRLALRGGTPFIRKLFVGLVVVLIARMGWETFGG